MATVGKNISECDWESEVKAFQDSKAGVKGLVDAGTTKVPLIFIHPPDNTKSKSDSAVSEFRLPLIDLAGVNDSRRAKIIDQVREACENWGVFLAVNHGIPASVLEEMIDGIRRFHEQDAETKKEFYSFDFTQKVSFLCNMNLSRPTPASWRDSLMWPVNPNLPDPTEFPAVCRDIALEYSKQVEKLGYSLFELLSEGLGLDANHLKDMEIAETIFHGGHYYPPCPEPELSLGIERHYDTGFLTIILQDQVGSLQVLHQNQWIDVVPHPGALVIIVGLSLQVVTNDRFKGLEHRVLANGESTRVSMASGFSPTFFPSSKVYSPIKELVSKENPPKYEKATMAVHAAYLKGQKV